MAGMSALGFLAFFVAVSGVGAAAGSSTGGGFSVFGHVEIKLENYASERCPLWISVSIRDQVWSSELASDFYVLEVPLEPFLGSPGIIDLALAGSGGESWNLWRRSFVVDDSGGYHADAVLTGDVPVECSSNTADEDKNEAKFFPLAPRIFQSEGLDICPARNEPTCPNPYSAGEDPELKNPDSIPDSLQVEPTEVESDAEQTRSCCMLFGNPAINTLHLLLIATIGAVIYSINLGLRALLSLRLDSDDESLLQEHPAAAWELWSVPSKKGRLAAAAAGGASQCNTIASGTGCFNKAWAEAHRLLSGSVDEHGPCCFGYNYSASGSNRRSGKWNRDAFGRLIRS